MNLVEAELFSGLSDEEITTLLQCLKAVRRSYKKGEVILAEGSVTENIGVVLSGRLIIYGTDAWGNTSVFGSIDCSSRKLLCATCKTLRTSDDC